MSGDNSGPPKRICVLRSGADSRWKAGIGWTAVLRLIKMCIRDMFYGVIFLFGTSYLLLVSVATTTFKLNYQKQFCFKAVLSLGVEQLVLCVLAFAAQQSMLLCVLLNGLVPFLLVFLRTTRFNQRGYFINGMVFVFLQLRPVDKEGLLPQLLAVSYTHLDVYKRQLSGRREADRNGKHRQLFPQWG